MKSWVQCKSVFSAKKRRINGIHYYYCYYFKKQMTPCEVTQRFIFASHLFVCVGVDRKQRLLELKLLCSQQLAPPRFCV